MSSESLFRWSDHTLVEIVESGVAQDAIMAADSLLVRDGLVFASDLHRERFMKAVTVMSLKREEEQPNNVDAFWHAAFSTIPRHGNWFPRLEHRSISACRPLSLKNAR